MSLWSAQKRNSVSSWMRQHCSKQEHHTTWLASTVRFVTYSSQTIFVCQAWVQLSHWCEFDLMILNFYQSDSVAITISHSCSKLQGWHRAMTASTRSAIFYKNSDLIWYLETFLNMNDIALASIMLLETNHDYIAWFSSATSTLLLFDMRCWLLQQCRLSPIPLRRIKVWPRFTMKKAQKSLHKQFIHE